MGAIWTVFIVIIAFLLPPLAVLLERGLWVDFIINIGLTLLGWIPGVIHALYVIFGKQPSAATHDIL